MPVFLNTTTLATKTVKAFRAVFLRDPLERLLRSYIQKCDTEWIRKMEMSCEPNPLFNVDANTTDKDLLNTIRDNRKQMFEAYVEHFHSNERALLSSITCGGLFRYIKEYEFVGIMGNNFYKDL